jgi:hypothetical protein
VTSGTTAEEHTGRAKESLTFGEDHDNQIRVSHSRHLQLLAYLLSHQQHGGCVQRLLHPIKYRKNLSKGQTALSDEISSFWPGCHAVKASDASVGSAQGVTRVVGGQAECSCWM